MKIILQKPEIKKTFLNDIDEDTVYFDIETTGLNRKKSFLYLVGCMWKENDEFILKQWLCERPKDEAEILREVLCCFSGFKNLIHFNGSSFDVPYLKNKAAFYEMGEIFDRSIPENSMDLYQEYHSFKNLLSLPDMKLQHIEEICGYSRKDHHSGKELINVYDQYLSSKDPNLEETLLRHNYDDIVGMVHIGQLAVLKKLMKQEMIPEIIDLKQEEKDYLSVYCTCPGTFGLNGFVFHTDDLTLSVAPMKPTGNILLTIHIPLYTGELYYYFKDYKNYYYLPAEDKAIHKSVGVYVSPQAREKATKDNCYDKKFGIFIPDFRKGGQFFYKKGDKNRAFTLFNPKTAETNDEMATYISALISYILKHA